jgi:hypothetical protein
MRYNPKQKCRLSSEGARVIAKDFTVLQNPSLQTATVRDYTNAYELPSNQHAKSRKGYSNGVWKDHI